MPNPVFAFAAALALGLPAGAEEYDGRYRIVPGADCAAPEGDPGILRIEDDVLYGAESVCRMTDPVDVRDMDATLYDMVCTGEGMAWRERAMLMHGAEDELVLVWDGYAFAYPACPEAPIRPRPRPSPRLAAE
ncbi:hypothetical protein DLJ49_04980 [Rhodovulum sp. 12E13]|uniref:hypothetical protein n=1 Tax=Rhodovulum sp. 12E13 TaxID=2203891 RepID=UPI000E189C1B|nr:hypothetical protein [Rhodovulum sp. 12E13]RDC74033.1 hypothetical protein DLJ49_04980 [Rhodovulum sp. 12E13]